MSLRSPVFNPHPSIRPPLSQIGHANGPEPKPRAAVVVVVKKGGAGYAHGRGGIMPKSGIAHAANAQSAKSSPRAWWISSNSASRG